MISRLIKQNRSVIVALIICNYCLGQNELPAYNASDSSAPTVKHENIAKLERFWPYWVALTKELPGASVPVGLQGVLLRIQSDNQALVDFGRDGVQLVPVIDTDLIERAEKIRNGTEKKDAPNFTFLIGSRLVQSSTKTIMPLPFEVASGKAAYLCMFIPTEGNVLEQITGAVKSLEIPRDIMPVIFPLGESHDKQIFARLKAAKCTWSFVYDHLAESYTRSLLPEGLYAPAIVVVSSEGRVLFEQAWSMSVVEGLKNSLKLKSVPHETNLPVLKQ